MGRYKKNIQKIFESKMKRRNDLAKLPIEEKIKILVQLQEIASPVYKRRGIKKEPWKINI